MAMRTAKQKAALRKAQLASARKRKGRGRGRKTLKQRWKKVQTGAGAIHRRRKAQWNSGRVRDKAKVVLKSGSTGGGTIHLISYARNSRRKKRKR